MRIAAALFAALATTAAVAAEESVEVTFDRAELTTEAGRAALDARVQRAASDVCRELSLRDASARRTEQACIRNAVADAEVQIERIYAELGEDLREIRVAARD